MITYYEILEVPIAASVWDIKRAYWRLALKWHPDRSRKNQNEAESKFKEISEAHEVLSDSNRRQKYDQRQMKKLKRDSFRNPKQAFWEFLEEMIVTKNLTSDWLNIDGSDLLLDDFVSPTPSTAGTSATTLSIMSSVPSVESFVSTASSLSDVSDASTVQVDEGAGGKVRSWSLAVNGKMFGIMVEVRNGTKTLTISEEGVPILELQKDYYQLAEE